MINVALRGLEIIYKEGCEYKKAGVIMQGLTPENIQQDNVFLPNYDPKKQQQLMATIDKLNNKFGRNTVFWAVSGIDGEGRGGFRPLSNRHVDNSWAIKREKASPRYTTNWNELPVVKASFSLNGQKNYQRRKHTIAGCFSDDRVGKVPHITLR